MRTVQHAPRVFLLSLVAVLTVGSLPARAGFFNERFDMNLLPPDPSTNRLTLDIDIDIGLGSDSDTTDLSGDITVATSFDLVDLVADFDELTFTGGAVSATDMDFNFALGLLQLDSSGVAGTPTTPLPPGAVSATTFDAAEQEILLDQGVIVASGLVNQTIDLAVEPTTAGGSGSGQFGVFGSTVNGMTATYDVMLLLPVFSQDTTLIDTLTVTTTITGTIIATGSFAVEIPEPSAGALLVGAALPLLCRRRAPGHPVNSPLERFHP